MVKVKIEIINGGRNHASELVMDYGRALLVEKLAWELAEKEKRELAEKEKRDGT